MARKTVVKASIIADAAAFVKGVRAATTATDRFGRSAKRTRGRDPFAGMAKSALRAAAATASFYAVYDQGRKAVNETKDLAKSTIQLTRTTGLSTKEASRFVAITKVRGIEMTKLAASFTIFSKQIVAAQDGSEKAVETFKRLGISQKELAKGNTKDLFMQAADGLAALDNGYRKTDAAAKLFGRGYQALFPLLDMGGKGIAEQLQLAGDLGAELDGNGVESFKKYAAAEREAKLATLGFRLQVGTYLLPKLTEAIGVFQQWVKEFKKGRGPIAKAKDAVVGLYNAVKPLGELLINHPKLVMGAVAAYLVFKATLLGLGLYNAFMTALGSVPLYAASGKVRGAAFSTGFAIALPAAFAGILLLLREEAKKKIKEIIGDIGRGIPEEIQRTFANFATLDISAFFTDVIKGNTPLFVQSMKFLGQQAVRGIADGISGAAKWVWGALKKLFGGGKGTLGTIRAPKLTGAAGLISSVKGALANAVKAVTSAAGRFASSGAALAVRLAAGAKSKGSALATTIGGAVSKAVAAVRAKVSAMVSAGAAIAQGVARGIGNSVGSVIDAARRLASSIPDKLKKLLGINSPSKVAAEIGQNVVEGMAAGLSRTGPVDKAVRALTAKVTGSLKSVRGGDLAAAGTFGVGTEVALAEAQRDVRNPQGKSKKARRNFKKEAERRVSRLEAQQRRNEAKESLRAFVDGIKEQIKQTRLAEILAPVEKARGERARREYERNAGSVGRAITRNQADINSPEAQARLIRERTRLEAKLVQARRRGDLDLIDDLEAQKEALERRYSTAYITDLQDQLAELNDSETERTAEKAASDFAATFAAGLDQALAGVLNGGAVKDFFDSLRNIMGQAGVPVGSVDASGAGSAAATVSPAASWKTRISNYLKGRAKGAYDASDIARALNTTKANVWANKPKMKGYTIRNRANGGRLGNMTLVGETGPELIVGNQVMSGTRTRRLGAGAGGMNITINATGAAANNPQLLARELGWQLATR